MAVYMRGFGIFVAKSPGAVGFAIDNCGALATAKIFFPASAAAAAVTADPALSALGPRNAAEPPSELRR